MDNPNSIPKLINALTGNMTSASSLYAMRPTRASPVSTFVSSIKSTTKLLTRSKSERKMLPDRSMTMTRSGFTRHSKPKNIPKYNTPIVIIS